MSAAPKGKEEDPSAITIANSSVEDKYKIAAGFVNATLAEVATRCVAGAKIIDICTFGDEHLNTQLAGVYNKGKIEKGVAFPTCLSVNHVSGNFSPTTEDDGGADVVLNDGDLVKIDLAAHIDGYVSAGATSVVVTSDSSTALTGRAADAVAAAHTAAEGALRVIKAGAKNTEVGDVITRIAKEFDCVPVKGVVSHAVARFEIDGKKTILPNPDPENKVEEWSFEPNEVYHLDVMISTGDGKTRPRDFRTTVYKRQMDQSFQLKMKASRAVLSEITTRFSYFPFTMRALPDSKARLGLGECLKHGLLGEYHVLEEKPGEFVAQFKYTVFVKENGITRITAVNPPFVKSEHEVKDEELKAILATSIGNKKKKKNNKKKKAKAMDTE